jgi:excisionase family DNA binding protein
MMTISQVQERLRVRELHVRKAIRSGELPVYREGRGVWLVKEEEVLAWVERCQIPLITRGFERNLKTMRSGKVVKGL